MASAWGNAWGSSWGNSWGSIASGGGGTDPPPVEPPDPEDPDADLIYNAEALPPPVPNYLICDVTGFKVPVSEGLKKEWDGTMVRSASYTPRHPLDFQRARAEATQTGSPRPEQDDIDIDEQYPTGVSLDDLDP
jgi:hypothetical protein